MIQAETPIDRGLLDLAIDIRSSFFTPVAEALSWLGSISVLSVIFLVAGAMFAAFGHWRPALAVTIGSWVAYWLMLGLKSFFDRDRPPLYVRLAHAAHQSMPSGHAMMSMVVFGLIAVFTYQSSTWIRKHPDVLMIAPIMSIAIGISRIYLGVHWFTDVLIGWVIGAAWVALIAWVADLGRSNTTAEHT